MIRVLLVDDAISFHSMVEMFLRQAPVQRYTLFSVTSVEMMIRKLESEAEADVDVVLLDISLPDMNGLAACKMVHESYPELPIIIITAKLDRDLAEKAKVAGATDFILKPFDGASLRSRIQHALPSGAIV